MSALTCAPATSGQIRLIHVLMRDKCLEPVKKDLIYSFTNSRTTSTKEMSLYEAKHLIDRLKSHETPQDKREKQLQAIAGMAWEMGIIYGNTEDDRKMNTAKINMFCRERGTVKKNLAEQSILELSKTRRQFEAMYAKFKNKAEMK